MFEPSFEKLVCVAVKSNDKKQLLNKQVDVSRGCVEGTGSDVKRRSLEGSKNIIYGNAPDMVFMDKGVN